MANNTSSNTPKKRKKKKPRNRKQTVISILIILAVISFVLPDLMPLFMPSGSNRPNSSTTSSLPSNPTSPPPEPVFTKESELSVVSGESGQAIKSIDIEVADTEAQRVQGLMYRRSMKDEQGMLFIFEQSTPQSFWMRNTYIPLDILYVDENKKITTIHQNTTPLSETSLPSNGNAQYVLEVNGGWCQRHGVKVGDVLQW